jgi:D-3-phosphoglycerate dehydrogenase
MKILAISDMYVTKEYYENCFAQHPEYELQVIKFGSDDFIEMRDKFHRIERKGPDEVEIPAEIYDAIEDVDVLMVHICPVPAKLIARAKKLRAVLTNRGGLENIAVEALTERGIPLLNNPAHNTNGVAELAIGLMVTETRNVARAHMGLKNGVWREDYPNKLDIWELKGRTVGIVGFGNIGHRIAEMLQVFGCKILVNDVYYDPDDEMLATLPIKKVDLPTLMRESDIVTLHARNTEIILDREMLSLMQPHAFFINTARAHMVDYDALYELLRDRKIMGAALEVHPTEPLPEDYPFLKLDNVTLTTHRGGDTINAYSDSPEMLVQDYARYRAGGKVRFFVNPEVGFGK